MELGTFGAILGFALELEKQAALFYEQGAKSEHITSIFNELAQGSRKRVERLERARREGVAEMILEAISGLKSEDYTLSLNPYADLPTLVRQAQEIETTCARYYQEASQKLPIREVMRLFQRLAKENQQRLEILVQCFPCD